MSFIDAVKSVLTKYVGFSGRARRSEYWWFALFVNIVGFVLMFGATAIALITNAPPAGGATAAEAALALDNAMNVGITVVDLWVLGMLLPILAVTIRRFHDTNRSGWLCLISIIPIAGIVSLVFMCEDSSRGPNRYGPSPKYV